MFKIVTLVALLVVSSEAGVIGKIATGIQTGTSAVANAAGAVAQKVDDVAISAGEKITGITGESTSSVLNAAVNTAGTIVVELGDTVSTVIDTAGGVIGAGGSVVGGIVTLNPVQVADGLRTVNAVGALGVNDVVDDATTITNTAVLSLAEAVQNVAILGPVSGFAANLGTQLLNTVNGQVKEAVNTAAGVQTTDVGSSNIILNTVAKPITGAIVSQLSPVLLAFGSINQAAYAIERIPAIAA